MRSVWTRACGYRLHGRTAGSAHGHGRPAIVLVHGLVISSRSMVPSARLLARDHAVLAPDLPGFGRSEKPARVLTIPELADVLAGWLDANGLTRPVLLANSMGCQIAVDLAARRPAHTTALVLIGPTVDPQARAMPQQALRLLRLVPREPASYWPILLRDLLDAGVRRTWHTFQHMLDHRVELLLPRIPAPALVVRGSRDPIVPQRWAEHAADLLPAGRLVVIPGAGHVVNYDAPAALAHAVRDFLATHRHGDEAARRRA